MSDVDLILQIQQELRDDPNPPILDAQFDPLDPVEIEMICHEADFSIDRVIERYRDKYLNQFSDPSVFENFVLEHKMKIRKIIHGAVEEARSRIREMGYDDTMRDPFEESHEAD